MPSPKKNTDTPKESTDAKYFVIGRAMVGDANLCGIPGDVGALVPADKFTFTVPKDRFDKLVKYYQLSSWKGAKASECGKCGVKFIDDSYRDNHGKRRHTAPRYSIKNREDLTDDQMEILKAEAGQPGLTRKDDGYWVNNNEFHVPDPQDTEFNRQDRQLAESIDWTKTAASQKG